MSTPSSLPTPLPRQIRFSDEQAMLLEAATTFCREQSPVARVRALMQSETGFDPEVWQRMTELGWPGLCIPEAHGGAGLSLAHAATLAECMGRHLLATPFVATQLAVAALLAGAAPEVQALHLPRIAAGQVATVALLEDDGDWRLQAFSATATSQGEQVVLGGAKTLVPDAAVAGLVIAAVAFEGAPALALLSADTLQGGRIARETVIDETRRCHRIDLQGLVLPARSLITGPQARAALEAVRRAGLLMCSAEAAGGIAAALDVIVQYLNLRTTFGRKIGSYQSLKHTSAEILIGLERARSHVAHAATLIEEGEIGAATTALCMAKVECGESYVFAGDRAVQFHGGFGFTWECDAQLHLRRALFLQHSFGDATHHRRHLAATLLGPIGTATH
jgi:acyl-CoA dehydrogenase